MRNLYGLAIAAVTLSLVSLCLGIAPPNLNWGLAGAVTFFFAGILLVVLGIGCLDIDPIVSPGARSASIVGYVLVAASLALDVRYALIVRGIVHGREWNTDALIVVAINLILHGQGKLNGPRKSKPTLTGQ